MRVRQVGTFDIRGDHGLYLDAIDVPSAARYAAVSYQFIPDNDIRRLRQGEIVELDISDDELESTIERAMM